MDYDVDRMEWFVKIESLDCFSDTLVSFGFVCSPSNTRYDTLFTFPEGTQIDLLQMDSYPWIAFLLSHLSNTLTVQSHSSLSLLLLIMALTTRSYSVIEIIVSTLLIIVSTVAQFVLLKV